MDHRLWQHRWRQTQRFIDWPVNTHYRRADPTRVYLLDDRCMIWQVSTRLLQNDTMMQWWAVFQYGNSRWWLWWVRVAQSSLSVQAVFSGGISSATNNCKENGLGTQASTHTKKNQANINVRDHGLLIAEAMRWEKTCAHPHRWTCPSSHQGTMVARINED